MRSCSCSGSDLAAHARALRKAGDAGFHEMARAVRTRLPLEFLVEQRHHGARTDMLISPVTTFQNCGNSSRLWQRRYCPNRKMRASPAWPATPRPARRAARHASCGISASGTAPGPPRPGDGYGTGGPGLQPLHHPDHRHNTGSTSTTTGTASARSKRRLMTRFNGSSRGSSCNVKKCCPACSTATTGCPIYQLCRCGATICIHESGMPQRSGATGHRSWQPPLG